MLTIEELKARYTKVETEVDELGRQITIGLLKPDQRYRVLEMTESTSPYVIMPILQAATVRKITDTDGKDIMFACPKNRTDVDIILNVLDDEGMVAVSRAYARLNPSKVDGTPKNVAEEAGN